MEKLIIYSLAEYIKITSEIEKNNQVTWFRGHPSGSFKLEPSLYRKKRKYLNGNGDFRPSFSKKVLLPNDLRTLSQFKDEYHKFEKGTKDHITDIEYLYLMQHYGILTRLLDFTTDPLIALYFAVCDYNIALHTREHAIDDFEESGYSEKGAAVYILNPLQYNSEANGIDGVLNIKDQNLEFIKELWCPIAIKTDFDNARIKAQKGVFMLFSYDVRCLEDYYPIEKTLYKIYIPHENITTIYQDLKCLGITHKSVFPDIFGLVKALNENMIDEFDSAYNERDQEEQF